MDQGEVDEGIWLVVEGPNKQTRYDEGMRIPPKGAASASRAEVRTASRGGRPLCAASVSTRIAGSIAWGGYSRQLLVAPENMGVCLPLARLLHHFR